MGRDVFVSYSQPDRACAFELTSHLESNGISAWIAPRDVSPAAEWAEEIIDAIAAARVMVLVFSSSSNESPQVRREVERAVHKDLRILPFRIEDVLPSRSLEYFLSSHHWLDGFPSPRAPHYERLCGCLQQWLTDPSTRVRASTTASVVAMPAEASVASAPAASVAAAAAPRDAAASGKHFSLGELRELQTRLARILGPVASVLVDRAAAVSVDISDLEQRLTAEIDSAEDRRRFLQPRS